MAFEIRISSQMTICYIIELQDFWPFGYLREQILRFYDIVA